MKPASRNPSSPLARVLRGIGPSAEALQALQSKEAPPPAPAALPPPGDPYRGGRAGGGALARYGAELERLPLPEVEKQKGAHLPVRLLSKAQRNDWTKTHLVAGGSGSTASLLVLVQSLLADDGGMALISSFFLAGGAWMVLKSLRESLGPVLRQAVVEIAEEPVLLGSSLPIHVELPGPGRLSRLRVKMLCVERVEFSQGSSLMHEVHVVWDKELLEETDLQIERGSSWVRDLTAELPADGMHSFRAQHNEIWWGIALEATVDGRARSVVFRLRALPEA